MPTDSEPIVHTDLVEENVYADFIRSAKGALKLTNDLNDAVEKQAKLLGKKLGTAAGKFNAAEIKAQQKAIAETNELEKKSTIIKEQQVKIVKALTAEQIKLRLEKAELNKQTKQNLQLSLAEEGSIDQLKIKLSQVTKQYNALSAEKRDNTEAGKLLLKTQLELTTSLNKLEQAGGNFHRQTGNYAKGVITLSKGLGGLTGLVATLGAAFGIETSGLIQLHETSKELIKVGRELTHTTHLEHLGHEENTASIEKEIVVEKAENVVKESSIGLIGFAIAGLTALALVVWDYITASEAEASAEKMNNQIKKTKIDLLVIQRKLEAETAKQMLAITNELLVAEGKMTEAQAKKSENQAKMEESRDEIFNKTRKQLQELEGENYKKGDEQQTYDERLAQLKQSHVYETQEQKDHYEKMGRLEEQSPDVLFEKNVQKDQKLQLLKAKDDAIRALQDNWDADDKKVDADFKVERLKEDKKFYEKQLSAKEKFLQEIRNGVGKDNSEYDSNINQGMGKLTKIKNDNEKEIEEEQKKQEAFKKAEFERLYALQKAEEDAAKKRKELRDKEIDEADKELQGMIGLQEKGMENKLDLQRRTLDRENNNLDSNLQVQAALMAKGEANTYSAVLKEKNENALKQAALDKKEARDKRAIQIETVFLEFMKVYAKDGWAGIAKAAGATTAAELFSKAIAGSAYEGTEDTGGGGKLDNKGGMLWMVHPHEGIVHREANEKYFGAVGAMNNGELESWAMENIYMPNLALPENMQGNDMAILRAVGGMTDEIVDAITTKIKVTNWNVNELHELVKHETENGIKQTTIYKRLRPNG